MPALPRSGARLPTAKTQNTLAHSLKISIPHCAEPSRSSSPFPIRGPGINNFDMALFKTFPIRESVRLQFRCELYNAFNHTQFSAIDTATRFDVTTGEQVNSRFGEFTAARNPRQMQFALRLYF